MMEDGKWDIEDGKIDHLKNFQLNLIEIWWE
jgi:hypothetical protein